MIETRFDGTRGRPGARRGRGWTRSTPAGRREIARRAGLASSLCVLFLAGTGCEQPSETLLVGHAIADERVSELTFGRSTADDVERIFGTPDERDADGTLVYRATEMRRSSRGLAGFSWASEEPVGTHVAKFRFADGKLSQICRERS